MRADREYPKFSHIVIDGVHDGPLTSDNSQSVLAHDARHGAMWLSNTGEHYSHDDFGSRYIDRPARSVQKDHDEYASRGVDVDYPVSGDIITKFGSKRMSSWGDQELVEKDRD